MVCIAAFIVLLILSAVSAKYRKLLGKGWHCVTRRVTFRPCDTSFGDEIKTALLAPLALRKPKLVRPASVAIEVSAWLMVVSMVVTGYIVLHGGLNLIAFGTCNRQNPEACTLADTGFCGVPSENPNFWDSLTSGDVIGAFRNEATAWGDTFQALPNRFRNWDATSYQTEFASFKGGYQEGLPVALEVIDPGCGFCAALLRNMIEAGFGDTHNITYIAYPILRDGKPNFPYSELVTQHLIAVQILEHGTERAADPTDWFIIEQLFTGTTPTGVARQHWLNSLASQQEILDQLDAWYAERGFTTADIAHIHELAASDQVASVLDANRHIVENRIRTVTIPTLITNGGLHTGLVSVDDLKAMR